MSDQRFQSKAVRMQSSAVVLAAAITTGGAVTSALIQTGVEEKPPAAVASEQSFTARSAQIERTFIELPTELPSEPLPGNGPRIRFPAMQEVTANLNAGSPTAESDTTASSQTWHVAKPLLEENVQSDVLVSPWHALADSPDGRTLAAAQPQKKSPSWGVLSRFFPGPK